MKYQYRNLFKPLMYVLIPLFLNSCINKQNAQTVTDSINSMIFDLPTIVTLLTEFPVYLEKVNFKDSINYFIISDGKEAEIEQNILQYYFETCSGDTAETYFKIKEVYFHALRLHENSELLFWMIFIHPITQQINSRLLFFDMEQTFLASVDWNLHAMYELQNGQLIPTNLKKDFIPNQSELQLEDYNEDGQLDYKLTRLYHNGTANALDELILQIDAEQQLDTLYYHRTFFD